MTDEERIKKIKALYPHLTDEECKEAADRLDQYLGLAWEIWEEGRGDDLGKILY
jgi:hypothetical protein